MQNGSQTFQTLCTRSKKSKILGGGGGIGLSHQNG